MAEVGRILWRSSCHPLLLRQGHLEQVTQDYIQVPQKATPSLKTQPKP